MVGNPYGNEFFILSHCELYKIDQNTWHKIPPLNVARDTCAACIFESQWIYVFGGRVSFKKRELTEIIERCFYTAKDVF